jgi:hypothetical protein
MLRRSAPRASLFQPEEIGALANPLVEPLLLAGHADPSFTRRRPNRSRFSLVGEAVDQPQEFLRDRLGGNRRIEVVKATAKPEVEGVCGSGTHCRRAQIGRLERHGGTPFDAPGRENARKWEEYVRNRT